MIGGGERKAARLSHSGPGREQDTAPRCISDQIDRLQHQRLIKQNFQVIDARQITIAGVEHVIKRLLG